MQCSRWEVSGVDDSKFGGWVLDGSLGEGGHAEVGTIR
ncbi:hypothetical protein C4K39_1329 [Pseudomonas sessilinigenes]|nr:hypothetical protein C4K39_1329 [Pseudomonas sessilinigenes]